MKTPVMIEVYKQAAQKRFSHIRLHPDQKRVQKHRRRQSIQPESDRRQRHADLYQSRHETSPFGGAYRHDYPEQQLATNLIIEKVDAKKVMQTMREMGAKDLQVRRGVEDT